MSDTKDLGLILDSKIPIVVIESADERQVLALLLQFAIQRGLPYFEWSATRGLRRSELAGDPAPNVKYADTFRALADEARRAGRGLWGNRGSGSAERR